MNTFQPATVETVVQVLRWNWKKEGGRWVLRIGNGSNYFRIEHNGENWYNVEEYSPGGNEAGACTGGKSIYDAKRATEEFVLTERLNFLIFTEGQ